MQPNAAWPHDKALVPSTMVLALVVSLLLGAAFKERMGERTWGEFAATHCRTSGSYDKVTQRATPLVTAHPLKVYHCDDGSIHVR